MRTGYGNEGGATREPRKGQVTGATPYQRKALGAVAAGKVTRRGTEDHPTQAGFLKKDLKGCQRQDQRRGPGRHALQPLAGGHRA